MRFRYVIIIFLLLIFFGYSIAQPASKILSAGGDIRFNHLNVEDGLPDNVVNCMLQDSKGFIWFGTALGLSRYDGNTMVTYVHNDNDSTSLCNSRINCIYEDNLHNVWVGTYFGLSKFDPVKKNFKNYYFDKWSSNAAGNVVTNLMQDNKGALWIATNTGIYKTNLKDVRFSLVKSIMEDHYGTLIHGMTCTANGRIFILMDTALLYSDDYCNTLKTVANRSISGKLDFTQLYCDSTDKHLWFGVYGRSIAFEFKPATFEIKKYSLDTSVSNPSNHLVFDFCRLNDSIMLAGCLFGRIGGGLVFLNTKRNISRIYIHNKENSYSLSNSSVWCMLKDRQNTFWIGTDLGVNSFNLRQLNFHLLSANNWGIPGLDGITIRQLCYDGNIWIGTFGDGLFEYNLQDRMFSMYTVPVSISGKRHKDAMFSMYPYKDTLWFGVGGGFIRFDIRRHKFDTATRPVPELKELYSNTSRGIGRDNEGNYWFGTYTSGIFSYNPTTGKAAHYLDRRDIALTSQHRNNIKCMVVDGEGNKWAGTYEDGFYRMDAGTNQINWNIPSDKQATVMQRGWINDIYCDKTGNAYIATKGDGLIIYTASTKTFRTIKNNKWTEDNNLKKIVEDAKGNLWMATGKGLSCWDLKNNTFSNYPEGMQLASMDNVTGCTSPDGTVYFAGADEILYFNPDNLAEISPYVHPEVTSVKVMNKEYLSDITQPLFLSYRDNFISFAFSAFDFINEKGDQFAYCLEGFDNDWNYCGNRHFAEYTNLPGGNYTLKLKVQNANGEWIETIHPVILHITTPYWKTWWFFMLCGVAAFALGYQFYYLKMQRKLEAERLRTRLARDLHDDIGSSLSSISMISKMALKNTPDSKEETQFIFNKISESSHKTMESMNDIVWIVNPENDLMDSLLIRMRMYFSELLESKGVKYNFIAAEEVGKVKLDMDQRKNFYLIFKEALNNLTKYSGCTEVMVKILIEGDKILMEIKDNGLGFYPDDVSAKGNGLKNMKERAKMLKGMLTIESKLGQGTTIKLVLPIT